MHRPRVIVWRVQNALQELPWLVQGLTTIRPPIIAHHTAPQCEDSEGGAYLLDVRHRGIGRILRDIDGTTDCGTSSGTARTRETIHGGLQGECQRRSDKLASRYGRGERQCMDHRDELVKDDHEEAEELLRN